MKKSFVTTLVLAGVFVFLLVWYQFYEKKVRPENQKTEEKTKNIVQLETDQIQELEIEIARNLLDAIDKKTTPLPAPQYERILFKKAGDQWTLMAPLEDDANSSNVSSMISSLASTKSERVVDAEPKDLEAFGLKNPVLKIRFKKDSSAAAQGLLVGGDSPVGFNSYVQTEGNKEVLLAPRSLKNAFNKKLDDLRNKKLVTLNRPDVLEVEIENKGEELIIKKDDKSNWILSRTNIPADSGEWDKTFNAILDLRATEFADEGGKDLAKFGLKNPLSKITLKTKEAGKKAELWLGKVGGKFYLKKTDKNVIYEIDKELWEKLRRPETEYRSLALAKFNRFQINRIRLERATDPLELQKDNMDWNIPSDQQARIDSAKVESFLTKMQDMKISKYLPSNAQGAKNPDLVLQLFEKDGETEKEKITLKFAKSGRVIKGESTENSVPFVIKSKDFDELNLKKDRFLKVEEKKEEPKAEKTEKPQEVKPSEKG